MAASPLSQAIRQLETELGVELFVRTTRSVALTEAGRRLAAEGPAALAAIDAAFANASRAGQGVLGTLRLGTTPAARFEIRPALLAALRASHPGIAVDASEATTGHLTRELLSRRLDVAIGFCTDPVPGVARRPWRDEPVHVLMRVPRGESVELAALRACRFVVPGVGLNEGFGRRQRRLCAAAGFTPSTVVAGFIWDDAEWPPGDDVVALATERVVRARAPHMHSARLVPPTTLPLELLWREDDESPVLRTFLEVASALTVPPPGVT